MKIVLALLFSLSVFTPITFAQTENLRVLLEYQYGNQITSSHVVVLSNGLVIYKRRLLTEYKYLPSRQLTEVKLKELITAIDSAAKANSIYSDGEPTSFGSSAGALIAYTTSGKGSTIFASSLNASSQKIKLAYQRGPDADTVRSLIQDFVTEKMPLQLIESNE